MESTFGAKFVSLHVRVTNRAALGLYQNSLKYEYFITFYFTNTNYITNFKYLQIFSYTIQKHLIFI